MHIVICVKQVPNPEIPPGKFRIDSAAKCAAPPEGIPPVINPFDEQAVEVALRIKEQQPDTKITVISMGPASVKDVVKHGLAMGADEGVILEDKAFDGSDGFGTAHILTKAIEKIGQYDLILCGRQAADWDVGQVGSLIAENLDLPIVTRAQKIECSGNKLAVEHVIMDGYEVVEIPMPALITVSNEVGQPRLPTGMGIIKANRAKVPTWTAQDIGADVSKIGPNAARIEILDIFVPTRDGKCEILEGESVAEAIDKLAMRLREEKII